MCKNDTKCRKNKRGILLLLQKYIFQSNDFDVSRTFLFNFEKSRQLPSAFLAQYYSEGQICGISLVISSESKALSPQTHNYVNIYLRL